jgi:S-adenosylmethionine hydrolase
MTSPQIVTFLTDFGWSGGYVAACEGTIARVCGPARVVHISHEVPMGDVAAGALVLSRVTPFFPPAIHLAVIDPGVGTARRPIMISTGRGDRLVGPDNGLLVDAADALGGAVGVWALDIERTRSQAGMADETISSTFHGRDLFAPAAALLAAGADPSTFGTPAAPRSLVRLAGVTWERTETSIAAPVVEIDRFGNVGLGLTFADLQVPAAYDDRILVGLEGEELGEWSARIARTYGDLLPGELGLIQDSWGHAALVLNEASAAELLGVRRHDVVVLCPEGVSMAGGPKPEGRAGKRTAGPANRTGPSR